METWQDPEDGFIEEESTSPPPKTYPKFSDFSTEENINLSGNKIPLVDILGKEILIEGFRTMRSKYGETQTCLQIQFSMDSKTYVTFTNSKILLRQITDYQKKIPFYTSIVKKNKYYTLS